MKKHYIIYIIYILAALIALSIAHWYLEPAVICYAKHNHGIMCKDDVTQKDILQPETEE